MMWDDLFTVEELAAREGRLRERAAPCPARHPNYERWVELHGPTVAEEENRAWLARQRGETEGGPVGFLQGAAGILTRKGGRNE